MLKEVWTVAETEIHPDIFSTEHGTQGVLVGRVGNTHIQNAQSSHAGHGDTALNDFQGFSRYFSFQKQRGWVPQEKSTEKLQGGWSFVCSSSAQMVALNSRLLRPGGLQPFPPPTP